jgi:hypothetical protein
MGPPRLSPTVPRPSWCVHRTRAPDNSARTASGERTSEGATELLARLAGCRRQVRSHILSPRGRLGSINCTTTAQTWPKPTLKCRKGQPRKPRLTCESFVAVVTGLGPANSGLTGDIQPLANRPRNRRMPAQNLWLMPVARGCCRSSPHNHCTKESAWWRQTTPGQSQRIEPTSVGVA